jgi:glycosyltransferase involved in cell wall biosynthesis
MNYTVSVIIPVLNSFQPLRSCLQALTQQKTTFSYEVVVIDDGSTENLQPLREEFQESLALSWHVFPANRGPAAARNAGIERARGDIILFTDADCEPEPDWVEQLAKPFADPKVMGAKGIYRTRQDDLWAKLAQLEFEERYECLLKVSDIDFIDTYCGAYRRTELLAVKGFDETFPKADNEDVDLSFRVKQRGGRFVFVPQAVVWHRHREGWWNYARLKFGRGFWRMRVYRKHPTKAGRDSYTPWTLKSQMLLIGLLPLGLLSKRNRSRWSTAWLGTCFPLARIAWEKDPILIPWAPILALVRGLALISGMLWEMHDFHAANRQRP